MKRNAFWLVISLILLLAAGCRGQDQASLTATAEFMATAEAALTQVAQPSPTLQPTWTASPTATPWEETTPTPAVFTLTPIAGQPSSTVGVPCDDAAFITDVTIPDDTELNPGESFTKTWRVRNDGSCAWTAEYSVAFVSGDRMGGEATALDQTVPVNQTADVSVDLKAPLEAGTYTGNWTIRNANGVSFGDLFYVRIVVPESATATFTPQPATATPTASATPEASSTPAPTDTPAPTNTPIPTSPEPTEE